MSAVIRESADGRNRAGCLATLLHKRKVVTSLYRSDQANVQSMFIPVVSLAMLLSGIVHLLFPTETERLMSRPRSVRIAGAVLLALTLPAIIQGLYLLAVVFAIFGVPRLFAPDRSIRLQRLYHRRVHGVLLMMGAAGLWTAVRILH
jgi:hypothetical protein